MGTVSASIPSQATQAPPPQACLARVSTEGNDAETANFLSSPPYLPAGNSTQHSGRGSAGPVELMAGSCQRLVWHHLRSGEIQRRLGRKTLETAPLPWDKMRHTLESARHDLRGKVTVLRVPHKLLVRLTSAPQPLTGQYNRNFMSLTLSY